jgi:hypothetical protein
MDNTTPEATYNVYDLENNLILNGVNETHLEWFFSIEIIELYTIEAL